MLKITKFYFLFLFSLTFAQTNVKNKCNIEYQLITTLQGKQFVENSFLRCNNSQSVYQVFSKNDEKKEFDKDDDSTIHINLKNEDSFYYFNLAKKKFFFTEFLNNTSYKVVEPIPLMNWVLSTKENDTKKINNLICNQATLTFRGRNYIAWYSTKIPISFGPWKFHGLPGIILEIYDAEKTYHWKATKITYPFTDKIDFLTIENLKLKEISLKQFIEKSDKEHENRSEILLKRLPRGVYLENKTTKKHTIELNLND